MIEEQPSESECAHYWLVERPNGPTSRAVCKLCGVSAEFRNSIQGTGWDREGRAGKRMRPARKPSS